MTEILPAMLISVFLRLGTYLNTERSKTPDKDKEKKCKTFKMHLGKLVGIKNI